MTTTDLRSYFRTQKNKKFQVGIPELVEATANVKARDALGVNTELDNLSKQKGRNGFLVQY